MFSKKRGSGVGQFVFLPTKHGSTLADTLAIKTTKYGVLKIDVLHTKIFCIRQRLVIGALSRKRTVGTLLFEEIISAKNYSNILTQLFALLKVKGIAGFSNMGRRCFENKSFLVGLL
jgi:hypothetical protein